MDFNIKISWTHAVANTLPSTALYMFEITLKKKQFSATLPVGLCGQVEI